jgi:hypothetical protein
MRLRSTAEYHRYRGLCLARRRADKLRARLDWSQQRALALPIMVKPRGMWNRTFERLRGLPSQPNRWRPRLRRRIGSGFFAGSNGDDGGRSKPRGLPDSARLAYLRLPDLRGGYSAATGRWTTSTATDSTAVATGAGAFFAAARLGLALETTRFVAFPAAFLALGRAVAPFFFWTFDDCFLRLTIVGSPLVGATQMH